MNSTPSLWEYVSLRVRLERSNYRKILCKGNSARYRTRGCRQWLVSYQDSMSGLRLPVFQIYTMLFALRHFGRLNPTADFMTCLGALRAQLPMPHSTTKRPS